MASLAGIKQFLKQDPELQTTEPPMMAHETPSALDALCEWFQLSPFERAILLLCAGMELDREFATLCAAAHGDPALNYPTFSLALVCFSDSHWSALAPDSALRHWQLIEVESGRVLTLSPLRIDERILHYLLGIAYLDKRLLDLLHPLSLMHSLPPSHLRIAEELACIWTSAAEHGTMPIMHLYGTEQSSQHDIAVIACSMLHQQVFQLAAVALPTQSAELARFLHLWTRETILGDCALLLDCHSLEQTDTYRMSMIAQIIEANKGLLIIASRERHAFSSQQLLTFEVTKPTSAEQKALWQALLPNHTTVLDEEIDRLVAHFHLGTDAIAAACVVAAGLAPTFRNLPTPASGPITFPSSGSNPASGEMLWEICRVQANPRLDDLAQRIEPVASWDDLVLPDEQCCLLQDIAAQVRQRVQVYEHWGFGSKGKRGLGISVLFAGASGVGKTMAAEVLANELHLELYRIDLSAVVSKYIGETEKNLRRIFDAAESSGVILLFDEADALFGKRSEVKDSHDRYANIEVSYLLQRVEAYRGLAILTSNMKDALDNAFLRRIRFIVHFPFPDAAQRAEIWRKTFPVIAPTEGLDMQKLAQLQVAGGNIRNIALQAAFIAADRREPIRMCHILRAARHEYAKLEKPLTQIETRGWDETDTP
jgi:hypothetical protein